MWSLADTLERIRPALTPGLVPPAAFAALESAARLLPARLGRRFYLERWLGAGPPRVDLIVRVDAPGRDVLAACDASELHPLAPGRAVWRRLASFARDWSAPGSALERGVEGLWLEFDLPSGAAVPAPRVFVDFARAVHGAPGVDERLEAARAVMTALLPGGPAPVAANGLRRCLERLPRGATMPYVGVDLPAREPALRVCVQGLGRNLGAYLRALGWPGDVDELDRALLAPLAAARAGPSHGPSVVHLDLAPELTPGLGLEYTFARGPQLGGMLGEMAFLDRLVERGWLAGELLDDLCRWPGTSDEVLPHEIWMCRLTRRLNHVKLTCAPGSPIGLKAYLCCEHDLRSGATLVGGRPWLPSRSSAIG